MGRTYEYAEWLQFECEGIELTPELEKLGEKFGERAIEVATAFLHAQYGPELGRHGINYNDEALIWNTYASVVGHGVGLWEEDGDTGLPPELEGQLDKIVKKDKKLQRLAEQIQGECSGLRSDAGLEESHAADFPNQEAAIRGAQSHGATHVSLRPTHVFAYNPSGAGYEKRELFFARGKLHWPKAFVAVKSLPLDAMPIQQVVHRHAAEEDHVASPGYEHVRFRFEDESQWHTCSLSSFRRHNPGLLDDEDLRTLRSGGRITFGGGAQPVGFIEKVMEGASETLRAEDPHIRKVGGEWVLYSHHGRVLGRHPSYEAALRQERAIKVHGGEIPQGGGPLGAGEAQFYRGYRIDRESPHVFQVYAPDGDWLGWPSDSLAHAKKLIDEIEAAGGLDKWAGEHRRGGGPLQAGEEAARNPPREAVAFFQKHAGYSYDPKTETEAEGRLRNARSLARAEMAAKSRGWHVEWKHDPEPWDPGDTDYEPKEVLIAVLLDENGQWQGSLGGIADPDRNYARVVEAELADEAIFANMRARAKHGPKGAAERRIPQGGEPLQAAENFERFSSWLEVLTYAKTHEYLLYQAPMDVRPHRVRVEKVFSNGKIRLDPMSRDADSFTADRTHFDRMLKPTPRGGEPLPKTIANEEIPVEDAVPWVKITRDPELYAQGIARAKVIGPIDGGGKIYELLAPALAKEDQEVFLAVFLNIRQQCIGVTEIHRGERSRVSVSRADVLRGVVKTGADHFIIVHNHPSGDPMPSDADKKLTKAMMAGAQQVDIPCIDHVVIGMGKYYSFADGKVTHVKERGT